MSVKTIVTLHSLMLLALAALLLLIVREGQRQLLELQEQINSRGPFMDVPPVPVAETAVAEPVAEPEPAPKPRRARRPAAPEAR